MSDTNRIKNVAIVGAAGNCGSFMTAELLKTGEHTVTVVTRVDSNSIFPDAVVVKRVDYDKRETLVEALRGQDALIITLSGHALGVEKQLVEAAGEAGVPFILPNEWAADSANEALVKDVFIFQPKVATRNAIEELGKSSYIAVSTGFWYEWTLAMSTAFGFDFAKRQAIFFDDGETKISVSTWPQIGRAVASLLSLPIQAEGSNREACLDNFRDKVVYTNSFTISQRDMLESTLRVTGAKEADWTISKEPVKERFTNGLQEIQEGKRSGYAKMLCSRVFYPDGCGDVEHNKGTLNELLGLPAEDLDQATQVAIERSKKSNWVA